MYTACPKCSLMLVVTTADLRAAQGHVRCGRCRSVFNALESLSETAPQETAPAPVSAPPPSAPSPQVPPPRDAATEHQPLARHREPQVETPDEDWVGPDAAPADREPDVDVQEAPTGHAPAPAPKPLPEPGLEVHAHTAPGPSLEPRLGSEPQPADDSLTPPADFELEPARERRSRGWFLGALLLVLLLAGQLINQYRGTLATLPSIGPTVRTFYGVLGIPVVPRWNVRGYEARQLGATVSGSTPRRITVQASIANRGRWPLPLPLLRVTLQDRYGRTIAARDVPPHGYLSPAPVASAMLPPGGRVDATVTFVNPGPQAIGFEIDACLREGASVVCAHGTH